MILRFPRYMFLMNTGALPSGKPSWVKTIAPESNVGLLFARWSDDGALL